MIEDTPPDTGMFVDKVPPVFKFNNAPPPLTSTLEITGSSDPKYVGPAASGVDVPAFLNIPGF